MMMQYIYILNDVIYSLISTLLYVVLIELEEEEEKNIKD